jgi:hypothetical protein
MGFRRHDTDDQRGGEAMSKDTQHTPGPWMVKVHGVITTDGSVLVAKTATYIESDAVASDEQQAANDRLIASAPDLLAERDRLKAVLEVIAEGRAMSGEYTHLDTVVKYQAMARAAIAKAEGRA